MANKDVYKITITNFLKHNPKSKKSFTHLMLSKNYFTDYKISQLTPHESLLFIYLLTICADFAHDSIMISTQSLPNSLRIRTASLHNALVRFQQIQLLSFEKNDPLMNRIEVKRIEVKRIIHDRSVKTDTVDTVKIYFDFELLYKKFPKKEGKSKGIKICKVQIKTAEDFEKISKAVENYSSYCLKNVRDTKYIKHFSTFMGEWRDWIDFKENKELEMTEEQLKKYYGVE